MVRLRVGWINSSYCLPTCNFDYSSSSCFVPRLQLVWWDVLLFHPILGWECLSARPKIWLTFWSFIIMSALDLSGWLEFECFWIISWAISIDWSRISYWLIRAIGILIKVLPSFLMHYCALDGSLAYACL